MQKLTSLNFAIEVWIEFFITGNKLRISSGSLKGRNISVRKYIKGSSPDSGFRPTSAKVREAIFNILQQEIHDSVFADLYAGTGAVGFEAISRGAKKVIFVEKDRHCVRAINNYIKKLCIEDKTSVYTEDVDQFLRKALAKGIVFDIIFADPPYVSDEIYKIIPMIDNSDILKPNGLLLIEHDSKKIIEIKNINLTFQRRYQYGDTIITLFRKA